MLACEHASNFMPERHGSLGLDAEALASHIAWDPGAIEVARELSRLLDAPLVASRISRLLYDCNRPPDAPSAIPARSETTDIPGNMDITEAERAQRIRDYYEPFRDLLLATVASAAIELPRTVLVTVHSFTRVYAGAEREVELGILHDDDSRFADRVLERAAEHTQLKVRRNEPYGPEDGVTHTLKVHGQRQSIPCIMIEIRNDLIADEASQRRMAAMLAGLLADALDRLP